MKAVAVFPRERQVRVLDVPEPPLRGPTEVRVRTREVGICGTDREILDFLQGEPPPGEDFLIVGHEALGEVVEVGPAVRGLRPGDWVVPRVRRPCRHETCPACRHGYPDFCVTGDYTERGIKGAHGFCAESFIEDVAFLHRVPEAVRDVAVLTEPLTIAEKALRLVEAARARLPWKPASPGRAVVLGAGPVGQLGALALMRAGYTCSVYSRSPKPHPKAEAAEAVGAPYLSSQQVPAEELARRAGPIDVVYEAAGSAGAALEVLRVLGPNGVFVLTGVPPREQSLQLEGAGLLKALVLGNQAVLGTVNAADSDFDEALRDLERFRERWPGALERLLTTRHRPEDYEAAARDRTGIKHVITFG